MKRLSASDMAAIRQRYEVFVGPEAELMKFKEYSKLYDQFVGKDLHRIMEHVQAVESENDRLRGASSHSLRVRRKGR